MNDAPDLSFLLFYFTTVLLSFSFSNLISSIYINTICLFKLKIIKPKI